MAKFIFTDRETGEKTTIAGDYTKEQARVRYETQRAKQGKRVGGPIHGPMPAPQSVGGDAEHPGFTPSSRGMERYGPAKVVPDYSAGDYAKRMGLSGAIGAGMGGALGGPGGAGVGGVGGAVSEAASMGMAELGASEEAQFGMGVAADLVTGKPGRGVGKAVMKIPGAKGLAESGARRIAEGGGAVRRFIARNWDEASAARTPTQRGAAKLIDDLPPPGPEGAEYVGKAASESYQAMKTAEQELWDIVNSGDLEAHVDAAPIIRKARELLHRFEDASNVPPIFERIANLPEEGITVQRLRNIMSEVSETIAIGQAAFDPMSATGRQLGKYTTAGELTHPPGRVEDALPSRDWGLPQRDAGGAMSPMDEALESAAVQSDTGFAMAENLRVARAGTRELHKSVPPESRVYREIAGGRPIDNARKALGRIFQSDRAMDEVRALETLIDQPIEKLALKRAAIEHLLARRLGAGVGDSPQGAGASWAKLSQEETVMKHLLGKRGYANIDKLLRDASNVRGALKFSPRMPPGRVGASIALAVGLPVDLFKAWAGKFGKEAAANMALEALADPDIWRQVTMKSGGVSNWSLRAEKIARAMVTRGLMTQSEIGEEERGNDDLQP